ncbi:M14 family metallopeptidase [Chloroflexus sp.]|uniref:M14 family metallopeptidase n=1 Tax=Chloroflexus sp. TaxID=1904827 RepID=UPI0026078DD5|nr:M14 family metallopeptidase [uncultured Chloroflexus sp.]
MKYLFLLAFLIVAGWPLRLSPTQPIPVREVEIGRSAEGRPIEAVIFGDGPRKLVVVGATHGAPEANTYRLALALIDHFRSNPAEVPTDVRLVIIPLLNPDGLARGWRFDAAGVDLNRNMDTSHDACPDNDWRQRVQGARGIVSDTGGPYPDSQVESRLLRSFLLDAAGAIFLHSNAGVVFPASCEHAPSIAMAQVYAAAAGYTYARFWDRYTITGGMHDWAGGLGIAAITPELVTGDQPEIAENLAGLRAVLANATELLPLPEPGLINDTPVPAVIYRFWRALGAEARFGLPLGAAEVSATGIRQTFSRAIIVVDETRRDTVDYVRLAALGSEAAAALAYGGGDAVGTPVDWPSGPFAEYWQRGGAQMVFSEPLSAPFLTRLADGSRRIAQYFERAVLLLDPDSNQIELAPLGHWETARAQLNAPLVPHTIR